jgi:Ca-activated chloride channel family protein
VLIQFVYPHLLYATIPLISLLIWYRVFRYRPMSYRYPLARWLQQQLGASQLWVTRATLLLRAITLLTLGVLVAQPQWVDKRSQINVEGVAMALLLDVSGSMQCFDDPENPEQRIEVAKREAIRFVAKRTNDPIALVIFGATAVSRVPLTMDKLLLREVIEQLKIGIINPEGTVLSKAMLLGIARLKESPSKSKVMILLTDGQPMNDDVAPQAAIELARAYGVKVYTIGIGGDISYLMHPIMGAVPVASELNKQLLYVIAKETGGQFFEARNPQQLRKIYDHIDQLEKTKIETPLFNDKYDWFIPFVWICIACMAAELMLATMKWLII